MTFLVLFFLGLFPFKMIGNDVPTTRFLNDIEMDLGANGKSKGSHILINILINVLVNVLINS